MFCQRIFSPTSPSQVMHNQHLCASCITEKRMRTSALHHHTRSVQSGLTPHECDSVFKHGGARYRGCVFIRKIIFCTFVPSLRRRATKLAAQARLPAFFDSIFFRGVHNGIIRPFGTSRMHFFRAGELRLRLAAYHFGRSYQIELLPLVTF